MSTNSRVPRIGPAAGGRIDSVMAGPEPGFRSLYDELAPGIRRYLSRLVGDGEAEDLTQEVFARAHRAAATRRGDAPVSAWLYRIATNAAIDRLRAASRRELPVAIPAGSFEGGEVAALEVPSVEATEAQDPDGQVIRAEMRHCILDIVDRLPPSHREVILLGELRGLSDPEIADALGITLEAAKMRLHRARGALRRLLRSSCDLYRDERNELACEPKRGCDS